MLELAGLTKRFGRVTALDHCSFAVQPGRLTGFLGPNGAGKTTAMRCIFGLLRPDAGQTSWQGRPVGPAERLRFGYMPEERGVYPKMRVAEQIAYFARLSGLSRADAATATDRWLERLGLADRRNDRVEALSHGNQQRVQLIVALVHAPDVLVLDEPFSGLDPIAVEAMMDMLRTEAARGAAVLFSSHQLDVVEDLCEDVVIIDRGSVVAAGAVDELRNAAPRRSIELTVAGATPDWQDVAGVEVERSSNGSVRLAVEPGVDLGTVVRHATAAGEVTRLSYQPPTLTELFRQAVGS
jgi:ABC-2 type transport system ATP-binding protein